LITVLSNDKLRDVILLFLPINKTYHKLWVLQKWMKYLDSIHWKVTNG
jgi:hypothetical protein